MALAEIWDRTPLRPWAPDPATARAKRLDARRLNREANADAAERVALAWAAELRDATIRAKVLEADADERPDETAAVWRNRLGDVVERLEREADLVERIPGYVRTCGDGVAAIGSCGACSGTWEIPLRCDQPLLCPDCRDREIAERRKQVRAEVAERLARRPSKAIKPRMVTVTIPHVGTLEDRIDLLYRAKAEWCRSLRTWTREHHKHGRFDWWLAFELTAGADFEGHGHFHVLTLCDFLPQPVIAVEWAAAVDRHASEPVPRVSYRKKREWCAQVKSTAIRVGALEALALRSELPWGWTGLRAPRRRRGETLDTYARRRVAWFRRVEADADLPAVLRGFPIFRTVRRIESDYRAILGRDVWTDLGVLPWLVVDVRHDPRKPVEELIKYTVKTEGRSAVRPKLLARAWRALRRRHRFERSQTVAEPPPEPVKCPTCGSEDCTIEPKPRERAGVDRSFAIARALEIVGRDAPRKDRPP